MSAPPSPSSCGTLPGALPDGRQTYDLSSPQGLCTCSSWIQMSFIDCCGLIHHFLQKVDHFFYPTLLRRGLPSPSMSPVTSSSCPADLNVSCPCFMRSPPGLRAWALLPGDPAPRHGLPVARLTEMPVGWLTDEHAGSAGASFDASSGRFQVTAPSSSTGGEKISSHTGSRSLQTDVGT